MQTSSKDIVVYYHPGCLEHNTRGHVENPGRLAQTIDVLNSFGAWKVADLRGHAPASEDDIDTVHNPHYRLRVRDLCGRGVGMLGNSTPACRQSYKAALLAAGGALAAVDSVVTGAYRRALALVRPPGHHALPDMAMGFCIFNNPALAARRAQLRYGVKKILLLDLDAHHGNGVERIFYSDPGVLYCSLHRDFSYPVTGWVEKTGEGRGRGYNVNIPLPLRSGDADYRAAWDEIIAPLAAAYRPELVLVCAGFDAHAGDPVGGMNLTDRGYEWLFREVLAIAEKYAGGKIAATLEGGYNPEVLGRNVLAMIRQWSGNAGSEIKITGKPKKETSQVLEEVKKVQGETWSCFK
ncbi:histone deacetylase [Desulfallas sp. Bu1-1]|uniref:histone deacetylase family protein n=1 Tax=Desulfallas sp. Bu1-1 TaxID=2787620 RepID=UPI00189EAAB4|nr:histone deacetylase [Desulfallas sp. Bu1-1]MBF7083826.1 histone deacetylase [Desulfallas sp. Bu1-1]